ncbi:uncharacterized protein LOC143041393 [Oratosquilla oratoria]|uniref:uncharacterized protein LOC143041393 n=1 Tax=Oratosquilla oratoria TaxID=337810 RepID=UPI003F768641
MSSLSFPAPSLPSDLRLLSLLLLLRVTRTFAEERQRRSSPPSDLNFASPIPEEFSENIKEPIRVSTGTSLPGLEVDSHDVEKDLRRDKSQGEVEGNGDGINCDNDDIQDDNGESTEHVNEYFEPGKSQVREKTRGPLPGLYTRLSESRALRMKNDFLRRKYRRLRGVASKPEAGVRDAPKTDPPSSSFGDPGRGPQSQDPQGREEDASSGKTEHFPEDPRPMSQQSPSACPSSEPKPRPPDTHRSSSKTSKSQWKTSSAKSHRSRRRERRLGEGVPFTMSDMLALLSRNTDLHIAVPDSISPEDELRFVSYLASFIPSSPQNIYRFRTSQSNQYNVLYVSPKLASKFFFA